MLSKKALNTELRDDTTEYGGISHVGETVKEFIEETGAQPTSVQELNIILHECGIEKLE